MTRKEIYDVIKKEGLAEAIKKHFNMNYTRIASEKLEEFIMKKAKGSCKCKCDNPNFNKDKIVVTFKEGWYEAPQNWADLSETKEPLPTFKPEPEDEFDAHVAIIRILAVLTAKEMLTQQDIDFIMR